MEYFFSCFPSDESAVYSSSGSQQSPLGMQSGADSLPPEHSDGNVEYKLKLVNPSANRLQHLISQMKWRLREGYGEAIYEIGVSDSGTCRGLNEREFSASVATLEAMASELHASVTVLRERVVGHLDNGEPLRVAEFLIRRIPDCQQFIDLRIAMLGSNESGKSTLLGVLTEGELDNGRGKARLNLLRHLHEIQSGRTSSVSLAVVGFDQDGHVLYRRQYNDEELCDQAVKVITFIDLAGHQKYIRTTISGLSAYKPEYVMLVVDATTGVVDTTCDHLTWSFALEVPVFLVVTKVDMAARSTVQKTLSDVEALLRNPAHRRLSLRVRNEDDAFTLASNFQSQSMVPIFTVSSVTGDHVDLLLKFLHVLPPCVPQRDAASTLQEDAEFQIDEIFCVPNVGQVVCGLLARGMLREGDRLALGPSQQGRFMPVIARSLQRIRTPCRVLQASQWASICIGDVADLPLRKGMVMLGGDGTPQACMTFRADVLLLFHPGVCVMENFQLTLHIGNVCQAAFIRKIHNEEAALKPHEHVLVTFTFLRQPEYVTIGGRLLFRNGKTKGMGVVKVVEPMANCLP